MTDKNLFEKIFPHQKHIDKMAWGERHLVKKWMKAAVLVIVLAAVHAGSSMLRFLDFGNKYEQKIQLDRLGIEITIPRLWDTYQLNQKPDYSHFRPTYDFSVNRGYRHLDFKIYSWTRTPETTLKEIEPVFDKAAEIYMHGPLTYGPEIVEYDSLLVHRVIGSPEDTPYVTYIKYQLIHQGSVISYTYSFHNNCHDLAMELEASEQILKKIRLTDVKTPVRTKKKWSRGYILKNIYPYDFVADSNSIDIRSARMEIKFPENMSSVQWNERQHDSYWFQLHLKDGTDIGIELQTEQARKNQDRKEDESAFRMHTSIVMDTDKGYISVPEYVTTGDFSGWKAIGRLSKGNKQFIAASYDTWHKGSHLQINALIPDDGRDYNPGLDQVHSFIENIEFY